MATIGIRYLEVVKVQKITTQQDKEESVNHKVTIKNLKDFADVSITITSEDPLDLIDGQDIDIILKQKQIKLTNLGGK